MGHSEGGVIAPMVAARNKNVAYIVLLAGTGVRGDKLLLMQQKAIAKASSVPEAAVLENEKLNAALFEKIISSSDTIGLRNELMQTLTKSMDENAILKSALSAEQFNEMITMTVHQLMSPWMNYFIKYDPYPVLKQVKCPALALNGSLDLQVPSKENLTAIQNAFKESGNKKLTTVEPEGLNHLFQECETGSPSEYAVIEQTFSPKALEEMLRWLKNR